MTKFKKSRLDETKTDSQTHPEDDIIPSLGKLQLEEEVFPPRISIPVPVLKPKPTMPAHHHHSNRMKQPTGDTITLPKKPSLHFFEKRGILQSNVPQTKVVLSPD